MPEPPGESARLEVFRKKLRHSLAARFFLRFHVSLILAVTIMAGWIADRMLLESMHVHAIIVRYPLAILFAYAVFFAGVAAWLRYSGIRAYLDREGADLLVGDGVAVPPLRMGSSVDALDFLQLPPDPEGCLWVLGAVVVFFALGGYTVVAAPSLFADVVLELLLAAGLLRGLRRAERSRWVRGVWANTWGSLAVSLVAALFVGLFAAAQVPPSTTLHELWTTMRHPRR